MRKGERNVIKNSEGTGHYGQGDQVLCYSHVRYRAGFSCLHGNNNIAADKIASVRAYVNAQAPASCY